MREHGGAEREQMNEASVRARAKASALISYSSRATFDSWIIYIYICILRSANSTRLKCHNHARMIISIASIASQESLYTQACFLS